MRKSRTPFFMSLCPATATNEGNKVVTLTLLKVAVLPRDHFQLEFIPGPVDGAVAVDGAITAALVIGFLGFAPLG